MTASIPQISAIVPILGHHRDVGAYAHDLLEKLATAPQSTPALLEVIFVLHGETWRQAASFDTAPNADVRFYRVDAAAELPAILLNEGARHARGDYLAFVQPGVDVEQWLRGLGQLAKSEHVAARPPIVAGWPAASAYRKSSSQSWLYSPDDAIPPGYPSGWLELLDYVPMNCALVRRDHFLAANGFSCSPLLQRGFWWEFSVRTVRIHAIALTDATPPTARWHWYDYPFARDVRISGDLVARRAMRSGHAPQQLSLHCDWADCDAFAVDLPAADRRRLSHLLADWGGAQTAVRSDVAHPEKKRLRVTVVGGLNEPAHNQLCFFNYFRLLEQQGELTWRTLLDTAATPGDLAHVDLVIFSRVKSQAGCALMDFCVAQSIPTLYMLDDNWFSVGREWAEYAALFTPGSPVYEQFMYCLQRADCVLTYNTVLADDLRPHSRRLEVLPTNIDLALFSPAQKDVQRRPRVAYVGSPRKEDTAFQALAELTKERDSFDVFLMSTTVPDAFRALPPARFIYQSYIFGYQQYAQILCRAQPDVLLAPLGTSRTEASKCPNKYLEITAAGSIGIYSNVPPYDRFIAHEDNGLLVRNTLEDWKAAIEKLLDDAALRDRILQNATRDVRDNFQTGAVLPKFMRLIRDVASGAAAPSTAPSEALPL